MTRPFAEALERAHASLRERWLADARIVLEEFLMRDCPHRNSLVRLALVVVAHHDPDVAQRRWAREMLAILE